MWQARLSPGARGSLLAMGLGLGVAILHLWLRPLLPIDETRYVSVAWEMGQNGQWLVPHLNGDTYSHKPPLLFWLINLVWWLGGQLEYGARLVAPVMGLASLWLTSRLAQALAPTQPRIAFWSPLVLLAMAGWFLYLPLTMFDLMLTSCLLFSLWSLVRHALSGQRGWVWLAGLGLGLGLLAKGPAILLYWLPLLLLYPIWAPISSLQKRPWYRAVGLAALLGIGLLLAWAIPAAIAGGKHYAMEIFWGQSAGRIEKSFAHARPWYWYLMLLPALALPWSLVLLWRRPLGGSLLQRFALCGLLPPLALFSLISGKQPHYLLPVFPLLALWVTEKWLERPAGRQWGLSLLLLVLGGALLGLPELAGRLHLAAPGVDFSRGFGLIPLLLALALGWPGLAQAARRWLLILAMPLTLLGTEAAISPALFHFYDLRPTAQVLAKRQQQGREVAYLGKYADQFHFLGRLERPLTVLDGPQKETRQWVEQHPQALLVMVTRELTDEERSRAQFWQPYRGRYYLLLTGADWLALAGEVPQGEASQGEE